MEHSSKPGQQVKYSSYPDLTTEPQEDVNLIKNINLRKRKNPQQIQFEEMKDALMQSFKEMINSEISDIKNQNSKLIESNNEIIKLLQINATNYKEISDRVETLEKKNEASLQRIGELEAQLHGIQKKITKNMVEIRNIPKKDNEDVKEIVKTICNTLQTQNVENANIYRRGKNNAPIIIEYEEHKDREILLHAFKKYNKERKDNQLNTASLGYGGMKLKIYISEFLTPTSKKILAAGRDLVKNGSFKYCWTSRGNILLRKDEGQPALTVNSLKQIQELTSA